MVLPKESLFQSEKPMTNTCESGKITWGELLMAAEKAGIHADDVVDTIDIRWGGADSLKCIKDDDFGWQISLCSECEDKRYIE